jgi:hypothetical protein
MRIVFALIALLGIAGMGLGVYNIIAHTSGPHGIPFSYENYGGPGPMLAGLMLVLGALYLLSIWPRRS